MEEEVIEAKDDFDKRADEFFNQSAVKETPAESSTEEKPEEAEAKTDETATAEVDKTEKVKEVNADESLSDEDKISKVKEILGDDLDAIDAYVKEKGYHNDPAWQKQREIIKKLKEESEAKTTLSDEDKSALDEFNSYRKTPEYIKSTMKSQGYTEEAIDKKLQESGFEVAVKPADDVQLVIDKLGYKAEELTADQKSYVSEVVKMADIIVKDRLDKILPKELAPMQDHVRSIEQRNAGSQMINTMKETVKNESILDFDKDINPALNKFMDDNPDCKQEHILEHFKSIYHPMVVERLKAGNKQEERDEKKSNLRQNIPISGAPQGLPKKTGDFDKDADAFLETATI